MASVTYDNVTKIFNDDVVAVKDLNIEIQDEEFLVFVGPSGCGKTTTLRLLAGLDEITEGNIYIGDRLINDVRPKDRDIAMVFQSYALYPHMTVYQNMAFGLELRDVPDEEIEERVQIAADKLNIPELLDRKPRALSGGQRQRVALGRAIVRDPAVFLLDEPLSNLDAKLRVEARAMLQRLHQDLETTFLYVTHDQVEAMTMGQRIAVMRKGRLQQVDEPQTLYDKPSNLFVAGFIGSPAMNFFEAQLIEEDGDLYVDTGEFRVQVPEKRVSAWKPALGKDVIMGIRPEDIHDPDYIPPDIVPDRVKVEVDLIELLGDERDLYLRAGDQEFIGRVDPRSTIKEGDKVEIVLAAANMHLFDAETEEAIR
jgi:multiple sugar transport system ATP-binding protein